MIALRDLAARRADPWGCIAVGALVACVVTASFGNDVLVRPAVTWSCAALVGISLRSSSTPPTPTRSP